MRDKVQRELIMKEKEQREQMLRDIANEARAAAAAPAPAVDADDARMKRERDMVREELQRERRRDASSGGKRSRDDRDVSERIALGMASTSAAMAGAGEVSYDERLFNQEEGMGSGFAADDVYNVYSGRLFAAQPPALSALYRATNKHGDSDVYGGDADEELEKINKTKRFKPDKGFSGMEERTDGKRERPVEFDASEESAEADDPFVELDRYIMSRVKEGKKKQ